MIVIFSPWTSVPSIPPSQQADSMAFDGTHFLSADELPGEGWKKLLNRTYLRSVPPPRDPTRPVN